MMSLNPKSLIKSMGARVNIADSLAHNQLVILEIEKHTKAIKACELLVSDVADEELILARSALESSLKALIIGVSNQSQEEKEKC